MSSFVTIVKKFLSHTLLIEDLHFQIQSGYLRNIIEHCFSIKTNHLGKQRKAEIILSFLFAHLFKGVRFQSFLKKIKSVKDKNNFLSLILYRLYFNDLPWQRLINKEAFEIVLFQTLASTCSESTIHSIWKTFPALKRARFLIHGWKEMDEGAYQISKNAKAKGDGARLIEVFERGYALPQEALAWLEAGQAVGSFVRMCHRRIEKMTKRLSLLFEKITAFLPGLIECPKIGPEAWGDFLKIFGLYGYQLPSGCEFLKPNHSLDEWLQAIDQFLEEESRNIPSALIEFIRRLSLHLQAFSSHPEWYQKGLESLVLAVPTYAKLLAKEAWLGSLVHSLKKICHYLSCSPEEHPIFVFDESEEPLFSKNSVFISTLRKKEGVSIIHLSKKSLCTLAKKLRIEKLLLTSNGRFGFGGCRNAIFLLAPLLKYLYLLKKENISSYIVRVPAKKLRELFDEIVLMGLYEKARVIHMGDDDVHTPESCLFSDALFAYSHGSEYFCRAGFVVGRKTTDVFGSLDLAHTVTHFQDIFLENKWEKEPFFHGMSALLSKPKICLNLPHGQEEGALQAMNNYLFDLRKPCIHLAGARYPIASIPTNRFVGFAAFLRKRNLYVLQLLQISDLVDPHDLHHRCALPWNKKRVPFHTLKEAIRFMLDPKNERKMQRQFWKNFDHYKKGFTSSRNDVSSNALMYLINQNREKVVADYPQFEGEMRELSDLFHDFASDALACRDFVFLVRPGEMSIESAKKELEYTYRRKIERFPVTHSLYLLCRALGAAEFQKALSKIILYSVYSDS